VRSRHREDMSKPRRMSKLALITGGGRGIGRSAALALHRRGYQIAVTYRDDERAARAVAAETHGRAFRVDLARPETFASLELERVDALVHNGGSGSYGQLAALAPEDLAAMLAIHFTGPLFLTQRLLPVLRDGAAIIQVSSGLTRYTYPGQLAYAAAKSAFETAMRYLAVELGPRGITANIVAPGGVVTDFGGGYLREPSLAAAVTEQTPLGRVAQPDDIGEIVAAIATMPWATGQRIEATGGFKL